MNKEQSKIIKDLRLALNFRYTVRKRIVAYSIFNFVQGVLNEKVKETT